MQNVKIRPQVVNSSMMVKEKSAMARELYELDFAVTEFTMYLDNYPDDMAALATFRDICKQRQDAYKAYIEKYGPLRSDDVIESDQWLWGEEDFPWDM